MGDRYLRGGCIYTDHSAHLRGVPEGVDGVRRVVCGPCIIVE
jgi:hypothetical protein